MPDISSPFFPSLHWDLAEKGVSDLCVMASQHHYCMLIRYVNQEMSDAEYKAEFYTILHSGLFPEMCRKYGETVLTSHPSLVLPPIPNRDARFTGSLVTFDDPRTNMPGVDPEHFGGQGKYFFFRDEGIELAEFLLPTQLQQTPH